MKKVLAAVVLLAGSAFGQAQRYIQVSWQAPDVQAGQVIVEYHVFRYSGACGTSQSWIAIGKTTGLSYDDMDALRSQDYCYVVRSYDGVEESVDSNTAQALIPPKPNPPKNVVAKPAVK